MANYREGLELKKREFAEKLDISESYYNMIENGKRKAPKSFLYKLVSFSNLPEEYWLYGIDLSDYKKTKDITKDTKIAIEQVLKYNLIKDFDSLFKKDSPNSTAEELLKAAIKADLSYFFEKSN
nr:helix-turn-helix transcriptional regulator [Clostridium perfringens]